jgi:hypothetical protein
VARQGLLLFSPSTTVSLCSPDIFSRCGKTTQVPQFILDDPEIGPRSRIAVTQPRRLSAMSVSERIATERGERVGHSTHPPLLLLTLLTSLTGDVIGYNIRLESEVTENTRVHFMTPGVLLRMLQVRHLAPTSPLLILMTSVGPTTERLDSHYHRRGTRSRSPHRVPLHHPPRYDSQCLPHSDLSQTQAHPHVSDDAP